MLTYFIRCVGVGVSVRAAVRVVGETGHYVHVQVVGAGGLTQEWVVVGVVILHL